MSKSGADLILVPLWILVPFSKDLFLIFLNFIIMYLMFLFPPV